jgi:hypothetical protein
VKYYISASSAVSTWRRLTLKVTVPSSHTLRDTDILFRNYASRLVLSCISSDWDVTRAMAPRMMSPTNNRRIAYGLYRLDARPFTTRDRTRPLSTDALVRDRSPVAIVIPDDPGTRPPTSHGQGDQFERLSNANPQMIVEALDDTPYWSPHASGADRAFRTHTRLETQAEANRRVYGIERLGARATYQEDAFRQEEAAELAAHEDLARYNSRVTELRANRGRTDRLQRFGETQAAWVARNQAITRQQLGLESLQLTEGAEFDRLPTAAMTAAEDGGD